MLFLLVQSCSKQKMKWKPAMMRAWSEIRAMYIYKTHTRTNIVLPSKILRIYKRYK